MLSYHMSKQMLRSCGTPSIPSASSFCRENKLFDQLRSVAYRFVSWPLEGSAFLLLEEIASAYPNTIALAVNIHTHEVVHVSSQLQAIVSQFLGKDSFLTLNDLEFIFKNHNELVQIVLTPPAEHSSSNSSDRKHQRFQRTAEMVLVDDDKCICAVDTMFLGSISLSTLRFRRFPLRSSVGETEEELEEEEENRTLTHAFSEGPSLKSNKSFHGSGCFSAVRTSSGYQDVSVGGSKKNRQDAGSRAYDTGTQSRSIEASKRPQSTSSSSSSNYSSSAMSLQMACGTFLLTSDKHLVPQQIGDNLYRPSVVGQESNFCDNFNSLLVEGGEEGEMEITSGVHTEEILSRNPIVNIVFSGGSRKSGGGKTNPVLTSSANEDAPTLLSATTTVDLPTYPRIPRGPNGQPNVPLSFDSILQSFLRVIPFHVMEIWVPVQLENGSTVLLYGASGALDKELLGWSSYSRNFSFNPDVGLPGRVATARTAESRTDVAKLPMPTFLRAEMAGSLGIHAACGLPFFTGNKCDAVVVFYSRHIFEPTPSLIEYMGRICESLNIRAQIRILKPQGMAAYGGDRTKYL